MSEQGISTNQFEDTPEARRPALSAVEALGQEALDATDTVLLVSETMSAEPDEETSPDPSDNPAEPPDDTEDEEEDEASDVKYEKAAKSEIISDQDLVKVYLKEIGKVPLLTADEEVELSKKIEAGLVAQQYLKDPEMLAASKAARRHARQGGAKRLHADLEILVEEGAKAKRHMLEANLRLVVSIAKRYLGRGMLFLDLIQEGNVGLIRAVEKFDYTKGYKFSTYATWWIRQAVTRSMADQARTIRIPVHMVENINKLLKIQREKLQESGREATIEELADELNLSTDKIIDIMERMRQEPISLDLAIGDDKGAPGQSESRLADFIVDTSAPVAHDVAEFGMLQEALYQALDSLEPREKFILMRRYGLLGAPKTLEEVGKELGVTRERIRQIESKSLSKLKHPSRSGALRSFLDEQ